MKVYNEKGGKKFHDKQEKHGVQQNCWLCE